MPIRVSCRAAIVSRILLEGDATEPAIEIVKRHMKAAAMNAARDLKLLDSRYELDLEVDYMVAYGVSE